MVRHYYNSYGAGPTRSNLGIGLFANNSIDFEIGNSPLNSNRCDIIKENSSGFTHLLTLRNQQLNFRGQALFNKLSDPYGYFLLDIDMSFNLVKAKSFSSLSYDNYDSFRFQDLNSGKRVIAIKTKIDGGELSSNKSNLYKGQNYSGHILMIY